MTLFLSHHVRAEWVQLIVEVRSLGWRVIPWDVRYDPACCDLCTPSGFACGARLVCVVSIFASVHIYSLMPVTINTCSCHRSCINLVRHLRRNGLLFAAPVCSSWVWMSRGSTFRSKERPLGDERVECVQQGNLQVSRLVLVLLYASFSGCTWIVEQPVSSLMWSHPRMEWLFSMQKVSWQS